MKKQTKSIQLNPKTLERLTKLKQKTGAHSIDQVVRQLLDDSKGQKTIEQRLKALEQKFKQFETQEKR